MPPQQEQRQQMDAGLLGGLGTPAPLLFSREHWLCIHGLPGHCAGAAFCSHPGDPGMWGGLQGSLPWGKPKKHPGHRCPGGAALETRGGKGSVSAHGEMPPVGPAYALPFKHSLAAADLSVMSYGP